MQLKNKQRVGGSICEEEIRNNGIKDTKRKGEGKIG
jgi:hypothetical protein